MLGKITDYLLKTYKPNAIILHGSRARGKERPHSDWDFVLLYTSPTGIKNGRDGFENQNIEFSVHTVPISDIYDEFSNKLQVAKVVFEEDTIASDVLEQASAFYAKGVHWSKEVIADHELWMQGRIGGMRDNVVNEMIFVKYQADFYQRVFNYWYWILQNKHSQPFYVAVEEVRQSDNEYYELVSQFASANTSLDKKVEIAEEICERLFT